MGRPGHDGLDLGRLEVGLDLVDHRGEVLVARRGTLPDQAHDLLVHLGVEGREGQVLQLPLHRVHAEAVREGGVDLEGLAGLLLLLLLRHPPQGAHVVQPVGQLDDQHPDVAGHRDDHLAHGLRGRRLPVPDLVELRDPVDELGDLVAEVLSQGVERVAAVLDGVVEQRRGERRRGHAQVGEDRGHRERMGDVRLAGPALLVAVQVRGHLVRPLDQPGVGLRVVLAQRAQERLELREARAGAGQPGETGPESPGVRHDDGRGRRWRLRRHRTLLRHALSPVA